MVSGGLKGNRAPCPPEVFFIMWLGALVWIWYAYLHIPVEIRLKDGQTPELWSLAGNSAVPRGKLSPSMRYALSLEFVRVRRKGGTMRLINQIIGFYELLASIKTLNPKVEMTGC